jgi:predicted ferric reductase
MKRSAGLVLARVGVLAIYAAAVVSLAAVSYLVSPRALQRTISLQAGLVFPLLALPMLALQPLLSARVKWLDRLFGLDRIYRFHKLMAAIAGILIFVHPLMLTLDLQDLSLLLSIDKPWGILVGKLGLLVLLLLVPGSLLHHVIHRTYERWRWLHNLLSVVLLGVGTVHAWQSGRDLAQPALQGILLALLGVGVVSYTGHKLLVPARLRWKAFRVADLRQESARVWTLSVEPEAGVQPLRHLPGQFQFLTLPSRGGRREEHPFTISSWTPGAAHHSSTIKESGDFTATIGRTPLQERVLVQGPFGRFSYLLYPDERDFVFLAGGVGITPFISMLRHMEHAREAVQVLLLYASRSVQDIAFRAELERIAGGGYPRLRVVHVLENPPADMQAETGRIDRRMIEQYLPAGVSGKAFYVCGPPPMMRAMVKAARHLGVARRHLHWERFAL